MNVEQLAKRALDKIKSQWGLPKRGFISFADKPKVITTNDIRRKFGNKTNISLLDLLKVFKLSHTTKSIKIIGEGKEKYIHIFSPSKEIGLAKSVNELICSIFDGNLLIFITLGFSFVLMNTLLDHQSSCISEFKKEKIFCALSSSKKFSI
jgi:hypothetical protein